MLYKFRTLSGGAVGAHPPAGVRMMMPPNASSNW